MIFLNMIQKANNQKKKRNKKYVKIYLFMNCSCCKVCKKDTLELSKVNTLTRQNSIPSISRDTLMNMNLSHSTLVYILLVNVVCKLS